MAILIKRYHKAVIAKGGKTKILTNTELQQIYKP